MNIQPSWSRHISPLAKILSCELITELSIPQGFNLALFLGVNSRYDNYESVRIWVQRMLDHVIEDTADLLRSLTRLFIKCVPAEY